KNIFIVCIVHVYTVGRSKVELDDPQRIVATCRLAKPVWEVGLAEAAPIDACRVYNYPFGIEHLHVHSVQYRRISLALGQYLIHSYAVGHMPVRIKNNLVAPGCKPRCFGRRFAYYSLHTEL